MRPILIAAAAALSMFSSAALAQSSPLASVTLYGSSCRDYNNQQTPPVMMVSGLPQLGATVTVRYLGPIISVFDTHFQPILITGLSSVNLPIPRVTPLMSANCTLLVNPDIAVFFMPAGVTGQTLDRLSYVIPNSPSMIGASVFHQWATMVFYAVDPTMPQVQYFMFSNAAQIHAGT